MGLFKKDKSLYEHDPRELDLELLSRLQTALVSKLILVNEELVSRYQDIVSLSADLSNTKEQRNVLSESVEHLEKVNMILQYELARITGKNE